MEFWDWVWKTFGFSQTKCLCHALSWATDGLYCWMAGIVAKRCYAYITLRHQCCDMCTTMMCGQRALSHSVFIYVICIIVFCTSLDLKAIDSACIIFSMLGCALMHPCSILRSEATTCTPEWRATIVPYYEWCERVKTQATASSHAMHAGNLGVPAANCHCFNSVGQRESHSFVAFFPWKTWGFHAAAVWPKFKCPQHWSPGAQVLFNSLLSDLMQEGFGSKVYQSVGIWLVKSFGKPDWILLRAIYVIWTYTRPLFILLVFPLMVCISLYVCLLVSVIPLPPSNFWCTQSSMVLWMNCWRLICKRRPSGVWSTCTSHGSTWHCICTTMSSCFTRRLAAGAANHDCTSQQWSGFFSFPLTTHPDTSWRNQNSECEHLCLLLALCYVDSSPSSLPCSIYMFIVHGNMHDPCSASNGEDASHLCVSISYSAPGQCMLANHTATSSAEM